MSSETQRIRHHVIARTAEVFTPLPIEEPFFAPDHDLDIQTNESNISTENDLTNFNSIESNELEQDTLNADAVRFPELEQQGLEEPEELQEELSDEELEDLSGVELTTEETALLEGLNNAADQSDQIVAEADSTDPAVNEGIRREASESLDEFNDFVDNPPTSDSASPVLDTSSLSNLNQSLGQQSPTNMGRSLQSVNAATEIAIQSDVATINSELPTIAQPTGLVPGSLDNESPYTAPSNTGTPIVQSESTEVPDVSLAPTPEPVLARVTSSISNPTTPAELIQAVQDVDAEVSVDTNMGDRPRVPLEGASNLRQMNSQGESHASNIAEVSQGEIAAFQIDFGENEVYPNIETEQLSSINNVSGVQEVPSIDDSCEMLDMLSSDEELLNEDVLAEVEEERISALEDTELAETDFETSRTEEVNRGMTEIREEEELTADAQIETREENRSNIQSFREEQANETEAEYNDYLQGVDEERVNYDTEISDEIDAVELDTGEMMEEGEAEAGRMKTDAEVRVEAANREAEEEAKEPSWFDRAVSAVGDFFAKLKEKIAGWINDLRNAVQQLFERIKQQIVAAIDRVKNYVIRKIRQFGEFLKQVSNIVLAKFPAIRDRFNGLIDSSMDWAEARVNELAEGLKTVVTSILDTVAAFIDGALVVFQKVIFIALDVFEAIAKFAIKAAEYFYDEIMYRLQQIGTLVAFVALIGAGFLLTIAWHFLGEKLKERAINFMLDMAIALFDNAPDDFNRGFLWPVFVNMMIGFLYELKRMPMETKMDMMDKVSGMLVSGEFWLSFIWGILKGIWQNIWGMIEGIWMLLQFIFYDLWVTIGKVIEILEDIAPDVIELIQNFKQDAKAFVESFMEKGEEKIRSLRDNLTLEKIQEFMEGLADDIRIKAQVLGARGAQQFKEFILSDGAYATIGDNVGIAIGYLIVEILLLVFTAGIGTAIKWGLKGVKVVVRLAKIFRNVGRGGGIFTRIIRLFNRGVKWLVKAIVKAAQKLAKFAKGVMKRFQRMFQRLLRKVDDIVAKLTGRRPRRRRRGDNDNEMLEEEKWREFKLAVDTRFARFQDDGITKRRAGSELRTLRLRPRFRAVVGRSMNSVRRDKGWYELFVRKTGGYLSGGLSRNVGKVPVNRSLRWRLGKAAIMLRFERIRPNQVNRSSLRRILLPFKDDYDYHYLEPEWDEREKDWDIMGRMSGEKKVTEISEFDEIFEEFEEDVKKRLVALRLKIIRERSLGSSVTKGFSREELEEDILKETFIGDRQNYLKIFQNESSISVNRYSHDRYKIDARLKVTDNRSRAVGNFIRRLTDGSQRNDPIPMNWFSARYQRVELIGEQIGTSNSFRRIANPNAENSPKFYANPNSRTNLINRGIKTIGIEPTNHLIHLEDSILRTRRPRDPKRRSFKNNLKRFSFNWANFEPDHVYDLGFGGRDAFNNLWPLNTAKNRLIARRIGSQRITLQREGKRRKHSPHYGQLIGKWFVIKNFVRI